MEANSQIATKRTLQELVAPGIVEFYAADWTELGTKSSLVGTISKITGIDTRLLRHECSLGEFNVATRMSWASRRVTTRKEDEAYYLIGIFQVNMPLLYGEGPRAFIRLQEEVMRTMEDYTLFAWIEPQADEPGHANYPWPPRRADGILAESPANFNASKSTKRRRGHSPWPLYSEWRSSVDELALAELEGDPFQLLYRQR